MKLPKFMCKVTKLVLKERENESKIKSHILDFDGDRILIFANGYFGMIIPKSDNIFNIEIGKQIPCGRDYLNYKPTKATGIIRYDEWLSTHTVEFDCGYGLNKKYMKYFDAEATYETNGKGTFVVYENGLPVGVIMGIKLKEE